MDLSATMVLSPSLDLSALLVLSGTLDLSRNLVLSLDLDLSRNLVLSGPAGSLPRYGSLRSCWISLRSWFSPCSWISLLRWFSQGPWITTSWVQSYGHALRGPLHMAPGPCRPSQSRTRSHGDGPRTSLLHTAWLLHGHGPVAACL